MNLARRVSRNEAQGTQYTSCVFKGIDMRRRIAQLRHRRRPQSQQARSRPSRKVGFLTRNMIATPEMNAYVRFASLPSTGAAVIHSAHRIAAVTGRGPLRHLSSSFLDRATAISLVPTFVNASRVSATSPEQPLIGCSAVVGSGPI